MTEKFDKERTEKLRSEFRAFRECLTENIAEYFKDRPGQEVASLMADWLSMDDLIEFEDRLKTVRKIMGIKK